MMVVSEMGEQWSPQTAPARHADIPMISNSEPAGKIAVTMGIRIPNVPQDVPVAKASTQATRKITAGKKEPNAAACPDMRLPTKYLAPSIVVIFLRAVAKVRIRIAGTICLKPSEKASVNCLMVMTFRGM